jgi:hypothetical protein
LPITPFRGKSKNRLDRIDLGTTKSTLLWLNVLPW